MASSELNTTKPTIAGVAPSSASANADGNYFRNNGKVIARVENTNGSPMTVTIVTPGNVLGLAIGDATVSIPATTGKRYIGPFRRDAFNDANDIVNLTYSAVTGVTIELIQISSTS